MVTKIKLKVKTLISSSVLFFFLVGLYPVIFLTSKNWFVYETPQLLFLLVIPVITSAVALIITGVVTLVRVLILNKFNDKIKEFINRYFDKLGLGRIALCLIGFFIFYILLEASIPHSRKIVAVLVVCIIFACFLVSKFRFYYLNIVLLVMTMLASGELVYSLSTKSLVNKDLVRGMNKQIDAEIKFKKTPNIYLLHLESYQSPVAMKRLYDLDNQSFVNSLTNLGFFVSPDHFSNYNTTLTSVGSMFLQQHHYYKISSGLEDAIGIRDLIGGRLYNPVLAVLKNNGYQIIYLQTDSYDFMGSSSLDYYYPRNSIHDALLMFQSEKINLLRSKLFNLKNSARKGYIPDDRSEFNDILWSKIEELSRGKLPAFFYIKNVGVNHSPSNGLYTWKNSDEGWVSTYKQRVETANPEILDMVSKIIAYDPSGIIILYGDHGAWKYRNIWSGGGKGADINKLIYERKQINGEDLALDIFGTFLAVRYPGGDNKLLDGETHVNIFRKLFSDLSQNPALLENKPANDSYISIKDNSKQLYLFVKDGKALKNIEVVDIPK